MNAHISIHIQWRCVSPKRLVCVSVCSGWLALALVYGGKTEWEKKRGCVCGVWVRVLTGFAGERVLLTCADVDAM